MNCWFNIEEGFGKASIPPIDFRSLLDNFDYTHINLMFNTDVLNF